MFPLNKTTTIAAMILSSVFVIFGLPTIILVAAIIVDLTKFYIKKKTKIEIPVFPLDYAIIFFGYNNQLMFAYLTLIIMIIIRTLMGKANIHHMRKWSVVAFITLILPLLNLFELIAVAIFYFSSRYIIDFFISTTTPHKIFERCLNITCCILFFGLF